MDKHEQAAPLATPPLPRERVGPFLILGVPKDADDETIEAAWAQRVLWARQGKTRIPLEDIHWARAVLRDPAQRLAADATSLNPDIAAGELRRLAKSWHLDGRPAWAPLDPDPPADETPAPEIEEIRAGVPAPAVPVDLPGVARWLDEFARGPIDPWGLNLPSAESRKPG
jgi:hypothetical protein